MLGSRVASSSAARLAAFSTSACRAQAPAVAPRNWKIPAGYPTPAPLAADAAPVAGPSSFFTKPIDEPTTSTPRTPHKGPTPPEHAAHLKTIRERYPKENGVSWAPGRRLSREAMEGLRVLHQHDPETFSTPVLAEKFKISPEAVRRILKSRWEPKREERVRLVERDKASKEKWKQMRIEKERMERMEMKPPERPKNDRLSLQ